MVHVLEWSWQTSQQGSQQKESILSPWKKQGIFCLPQADRYEGGQAEPDRADPKSMHDHLSLSLSLPFSHSFFSRWPSIFSNLDHEVKLIAVYMRENLVN